jgi:hypothetical protein
LPAPGWPTHPEATGLARECGAPVPDGAARSREGSARVTSVGQRAGTAPPYPGRRQRRRRPIRHRLERAGLAERAQNPVAGSSAGMRQRLAEGRTVMVPFDLLDEVEEICDLAASSPRGRPASCPLQGPGRSWCRSATRARRCRCSPCTPRFAPHLHSVLGHMGVEVPRDTSPGIRWVPASKATPPRASASRSPRGQCGHIDVARMSSRSPRYSPAQPTRPGQ